MRANPFLAATAVPPIPEAKGWTADYGGGAGPLIDLSQAVPGYPPPPEMLARLAEAAGRADFAGYGAILGDRDLREAYAAHLSALYGAPVMAEETIITAGCNQAFFMAMIALAGAGDAVMLPAPWYFNHKMTLDMLGVRTVPLPCRAEAGFVPDAAEAAALIDPSVRAMVLVTPNNPTGATYPAATIAAFAALAAERGIALVLDETYRDFAAGAAAPHRLLAGDRRGLLVQLYSFSKSYCIPGHRVGALTASAELVGEIAKIQDSLQICAPRPGQRALAWAVPALGAWREGNRAEMARRAGAFRRAMAALPGWSVGSIGAYFAYLRHPFAAPGSRIAERLARERGVLALPGSYFGPGQEGWLRVAFANVGEAALGFVAERLAGLDGAPAASDVHAAPSLLY